ncbi:MAG TPA: AI-2E family transporter [Acidimicrobiales bacterium]|nr:AI-2E family transporter [Acidimicrobiales bacterium]
MAVDAEAHRPRPGDVLRVRPTLGSTLLVIGAIGVAFVLGNVLVAARRTLAWTFATVVVAWLLSAVIALLSRWMRRWIAVILTILAVVALAAGTWVGVIANLRTEARRVRTSLPAAAERLERRYDAAAEFRLAERVDSFVRDIDRRVSTGAAVSKAAGTVPTYFVTGVLLLFLVAYGPRYLAGALSQIRDPGRRRMVAEVFSRAADRARTYVLTTLAQVALLVGLTSLVFYAVDLPAPFVLGLILGSLSAIPYIGAVLGGVPAVLLASADPDERVLFAVVAMVVTVQVAEGLLRRHVDPRTVRVGPALVLIVAIIGFQLYGFGGAVYAAIALVFVLALLDSWSMLRGGSDAGTDADVQAGGELEPAALGEGS